MEEFLRKYVSRRLLSNSEGEITAPRQPAPTLCSQGGAEAPTIFNQLICDKLASGTSCHAVGLNLCGRETALE